MIEQSDVQRVGSGCQSLCSLGINGARTLIDGSAVSHDEAGAAEMDSIVDDLPNREV